MEERSSLPSVGVVIPVRNGAHLIGETIESILWQTYQGPVSVVVVDDGSTDGVAGMVSGRWPAVRVISIPPSGLPVARNVGAAELTTDWLCFIDADDLWHPEHLTLLVDHSFAIPDARVLSSGTIRFSTKPLTNTLTAPKLDVPGPVRAVSVPPRVLPDMDSIRSSEVERLTDAPWKLEHRHFLMGNPISCGAQIIDRLRFHAAGGFPIALPTAEDYGFWLAVSLLGPVHATPEATFFVRVAEASMTTRTNIGLGHIAATLPFLVGADLARDPEVVKKALDDAQPWLSALWLASRSALARQRPLERRITAALVPLLLRRWPHRARFHLSAAVARTRYCHAAPRIRDG
ncbi:MAG: glycosyltransferase family A protein [Mycolicibacterium sp.]|uniref:glycosyltransferase family A protein n=1 Tax=Mycolicibacterium sp. TaxID=2320850 RepID=UPI003D0DD277